MSDLTQEQCEFLLETRDEAIRNGLAAKYIAAQLVSAERHKITASEFSSDGNEEWAEKLERASVLRKTIILDEAPVFGFRFLRPDSRRELGSIIMCKLDPVDFTTLPFSTQSIGFVDDLHGMPESVKKVNVESGTTEDVTFAVEKYIDQFSLGLKF